MLYSFHYDMRQEGPSLTSTTWTLVTFPVGKPITRPTTMGITIATGRNLEPTQQTASVIPNDAISLRLRQPIRHLSCSACSKLHRPRSRCPVQAKFFASDIFQLRLRGYTSTEMLLLFLLNFSKVFKHVCRDIVVR